MRRLNGGEWLFPWIGEFRIMPPQPIWESSSKKPFRRCYHDRSCSIRLYLYIQVSLIVLMTLMNRGTWRYRRDAFVSVTKRAILREAIIMLIIYPAEIFIESMRETLTRAGREIRENHESRITRVSFAFFSHFLPPFPRFYNKILFFFYQFIGITISRGKFCSNYRSLHGWIR